MSSAALHVAPASELEPEGSGEHLFADVDHTSEEDRSA
jgi:hypothetical protein